MRTTRRFGSTAASAAALASAAAVLVVSLSSCGNPLMAGGRWTSGPGSLEITIPYDQSRSIGPSSEMTPTRYEATGSGPDGASFSRESATGVIAVAGIPAGGWEITVDGFDATDARILTWTGTVQVRTGETVVVDAELAPLPGDGTLELTVTWPGELVSSPTVGAVLDRDGAAPVELSVTLTGPGNAELSAPVASGWYRMRMTVSDRGVVAAGATELVAVFAGRTSRGSFAFDSLNKPGTPTPISGNAFTLLWDPPQDEAGNHEQVASYNLYYREHGTYSWSSLGSAAATSAPSFEVTTALLSYGSYDFAVAAVEMDGSESEPHTSLDDDADPQTGWYVVWSSDA